ncbi:hypothetical protein NC653_039177 [Populus alba x Populus x berolinensis]|uniref:Uncharacterized protein n=1 Tax=Populus alba x Populus x berolinensis TaxID=444605 RepID=A0AAD6LC58_9ROSI|nr:hypothetical protein NC653_039177 [Populus alba x Populus x berolinensis]
MAAAAMMTANTLPGFHGLRPSAASVKPLAAAQPVRRKGNGALGARMDFIGSPTNLVTILLVHVSDFLKEIERLSFKDECSLCS